MCACSPRIEAIAPLRNDGGDAQRYVAILNQISDGCAVVDLRGNYLFVNDAFCRMFNYQREELIGANFKGAVGEDRADTLRDGVQRRLRHRPAGAAGTSGLSARA